MAKISKTTQKGYTHVVTWTQGRKRKRAFFESEKKAREFLKRKREELGSTPPDMTPPSADELRAIAEARERNVPLLDAVMEWTRRHRSSPTVAAACEARLADARTRGAGGRHLIDLASRLRAFTAEFGDRQLSSLTPTELEDWVHSRGEAWTIISYTRALRSVFRQAMRLQQITQSPMDGVANARRPTAATEIFTPEEAERWLRAVEEHAPSLLAGWAIAMFAGLRWAEVSRLDWSEVKLDRGHIEVTAGKSKTRTRRLVDIMPNLRAILEPLANASGRVWPTSPRRAESKAREAYGKPLPKNGARHSFVSYHLALFGDVAKTELQAGHDREVLFQHYRELVTKEDAERYFAITLDV